MARDNGERVQLERRVVKRFIKNDNTRGHVEISVIDWVGEKTYRLLEKREMYRDADGSMKMGKAKGFNAAEFALLIGQAREILDLLRGGEPEGATPPQNEPQAPPTESELPLAKQDPF